MKQPRWLPEARISAAWATQQSDGAQLEISNFLFVIMKIAESPTNEKNNKKLHYISSVIALRQWHFSCSFVFREPS
jgi:hypothetical protein